MPDDEGEARQQHTDQGIGYDCPRRHMTSPTHHIRFWISILRQSHDRKSRLGRTVPQAGQHSIPDTPRRLAYPESDADRGVRRLANDGDKWLCDHWLSYVAREAKNQDGGFANIRKAATTHRELAAVIMKMPAELLCLAIIG